MIAWTAALWAMALALPAHGQVPAPVQLPPESVVTTSIHGTWHWQSTQYRDGTAVVSLDPARYTVTFRPDGQMSLQADCNRGTGTYTLNGSEIAMQLGPMTLVSCAPGSQDTIFVRDLAQVTTYIFEGQQLVFTLGSGGGAMLFSPQTPAALTGTDWQVQSYNNGRGVVTVLPDTDPWIAFHPSGRVSGNTGCNRFMSSYTTEGPSLMFGPLAMTRRACASDAANAQEQAFMTALGATTTYELFGARLTLRDANDATQVVLITPTRHF